MRRVCLLLLLLVTGALSMVITAQRGTRPASVPHRLKQLKDNFYRMYVRQHTLLRYQCRCRDG